MFILISIRERIEFSVQIFAHWAAMDPVHCDTPNILILYKPDDIYLPELYVDFRCNLRSIVLLGLMRRCN